MRLELLLCIAAAAAVSAVQNLTSDGCADASGFQSCQNNANVKINSCLSKTAGNLELQEGCACEDYILNYNCYATYCWNQVWGCQYQQYMVAYLMNCPTAKQPVPYFPIPDNASGACSCNVGRIYNAITDSINQGATCFKGSTSSDVSLGALKLAACGCCEISGAMSRQV